MKLNWSKSGQIALCALIAGILIWGIPRAIASGHEGERRAQDATAEQAVPQGAVTPTPTPSTTPFPGPSPQIDGEGSIAGAGKGRNAPQFFILDVENEQITSQFLEGEFGYSDHASHISFTTGKIETVTINGNNAAFTGTARIGGKNKETVQFTVSVLANQTAPPGDSFTISLSNGYNASGNLTSGQITIHTLDPDPVSPPK
jgi:hypothetical protein